VNAFDYVFLVPFEEREDGYWRITIIPSRKANQRYLKRGETDEN
jgi:hypothetical protein